MEKKVIKLSKSEIKPLLEKMIKDTRDKLNEETIKESFNRSEIGKFVGFSLNYNHNFIEEAWSSDPNMANHLKSKFMTYREQVGSFGAMIKFYANLDDENREILENYIKNK